MLRDLTKTDWLRILQLPEEKIPNSLIIRGTRNLKEKYESHKKYFSNIIDLQFPNGIFENIFIGELNGNTVGFASVYGAPMASEVVHLFGVLGTSLVIQIGCCGGLVNDLKPGDIFIATEAFRGEGASQYYIPEKQIIKATPQVVPKVDEIRTGRIYTTSALLAEGKEEIEKWALLGCTAVDMETSATFATAEYFNMERTSILFVFDNPSSQDHLFIENNYKSNGYLRGHDKILEIALHVADDHNKKKRV